MSKRKVILHLSQDEVAVVLPVEAWEHYAMVYESLAEDAPEEDKPFWVHAAAAVRVQVESNKRVPADWDA